MVTPKQRRRLTSVPDAIWVQLKMRCLEVGITIPQALEAAITDYLKIPVVKTKANGRG